METSDDSLLEEKIRISEENIGKLTALVHTAYQLRNAGSAAAATIYLHYFKANTKQFTDFKQFSRVFYGNHGTRENPEPGLIWGHIGSIYIQLNYKKDHSESFIYGCHEFLNFADLFAKKSTAEFKSLYDTCRRNCNKKILDNLSPIFLEIKLDQTGDQQLHEAL